MKKQRSASPSQAIPSSAPSLTTLSMMNWRFSGSSGLGSCPGKLPSGVKYVSTRSSFRCRRSGPTIGPAMPFPPSTTTFSGFTTAGSMNASAAFWNFDQISTTSLVPPPGAFGMPASIWRRMSWMPASPERAIAPFFTSFAPVYAFGLCEAVHIRPPSSSREPTSQ